MNPLKKVTNLSLPNIFKNINIGKIRPYVYSFYIILIVSIFYNLYYGRRIIPGVSVAGINVGGMTFDKAEESLLEKESQVSKNLSFKKGSTVFLIRGDEIELEYDWESSVVSAFEIGRSGNFLIDTKDKILGLFKNINIPASYTYDEDSLGIKISVVKNEINVEPKNSTFVKTDGKLSTSESSEGLKILEEDFYENIINSFDRMEFSDFDIPVEVVEPEIKKSEADNFLSIVEGLVLKNLEINFGDKKWILDSDRILALIEIYKDEKDAKAKLRLNNSELKKLSGDLALEVNQSPRGKVVSTDGDKVTEFKIISEGKELDENKFKNDLHSSIFNNREKVTLTVNIVNDSNDKNKYGIVALIGEGTSHYAGSIKSRVHNLTLAAENTSGVLVPPGAIYSMNDSVGPIDFQHGFQSAYIIKGGRTVLGEGGGVCQTSTTLFRAVLNSGLPVISRYPHAYRVGYYEQDLPVGFDAAVFQPSWDFKFKNDTEAYILVQSYANIEENSLTFKLYGTPDGRKVEISDPVVSGQTPPPEPVYEDDPTLPKGVVQQVDYAVWGATSTFTRTVKKGDEVLYNDTFTSKYQPWRAVYKVGTKE
ncbi:MAG TPA: VanW family protein [bacterium]|nr:VanW family protein [bacterium]